MWIKIILTLISVLLLGFTWLKYDNLDMDLKNYPRLSDTLRIHNDLVAISKTKKSRNYRNLDVLNQVAAYIKSELEKETPSVSEQKFDVRGSEYKNIIASFGPENAERIIVGAHYDVCGEQEGADDNGSAVAGLLELARLLKNQDLKYRFDLVAYTLEEPPFFRTEHMGRRYGLKNSKPPPRSLVLIFQTI